MLQGAGVIIMKNESVYREVFIANAIRLVAEGGFEKATTRAISMDRKDLDNGKLNEAHIYRVFGTKEKLFAETFALLDNELLCTIKDGMSVLDNNLDPRSQCEAVFVKLWRFLLQNENKCRYYTRYYHSVYFKNDIYEVHREKYRIFIEKISPLFLAEADVWSIFHHVLTALLEFAIRVYSGALEDSEENATHIFNVVYCAIAPYLKII